MNKEIKKAAEIIRSCHSMIALTGAGISVESGIPDFRSSGGLWEKYDPAIYASIESFMRNPEMVWEMLFDMTELTTNAKPNSAHVSLAQLEEKGYLKSIITQNIDNLHQAAGSRNVIEYHGNGSRLQCMKCGESYDISGFDLSTRVPPSCEGCGSILKPAIVFFGEMIPHQAMNESELLAREADVVLVVGTSAIVYPAAGIPQLAKYNGATLIEFNLEPTQLTSYMTDVFVQGSAGETLPALLKQL